ncbi:hypothetical protein AAKU52_000305 [Pedobacter sp. CG_S7]|uniref:hypothetical protein n=1 Tax=Pedobacter sp. CG_S7 TaxID=3143930 RepID=UPI003391805E
MNKETEDNLKGMIGKTGFSVPEHYFEQLNRDIQTRIAEENLKALATGNGFKVPDLYFEQLSNKIEAKIVSATTKNPTNVIRLWNSDLLKYATAACFILITALGLYINNNTFNIPEVATEMVSEQDLFDIDEQLIIDDLQKETLLKTRTSASEQEIEAYILSNYSSNDIAANL